MTFLTMLWFFLSSPRAEKPNHEIVVVGTSEFQTIQIYVDISEVHAPDGKVGTSMPLNVMIYHQARLTSFLKNELNKHAAPRIWNGDIRVYNWQNVQFMPTYKKCDYKNAVKCGVQNKHWTLRTVVTVGKKYSLFITTLYDDRGIVIGSDEQTAWGIIRWHPRWKITKIKQNTIYGPQATEVFEQWPPKMEEVPPLITPNLVGQSKFGFYSIEKSACRINACK